MDEQELIRNAANFVLGRTGAQDAEGYNGIPLEGGVCASITCRTRDDEGHLALVLSHPEANWCHTACRAVGREGVWQLAFGFAVDHLDYAIEADLLPQEATNAAMAGLLGQIVAAPEAEDFTAKLEGAWSDTRARIERVWATNAAAGLGVERFSIYRSYRNSLALAAPTTRFGASGYAGVESRLGKRKFERLSEIGALKTYKLVPVSEAALAKVEGLSGHEKLDILTGSNCELLRSAREQFDILRMLKIGWGAAGRRLGFARPVPLPTAVAIANDGDTTLNGVTVTFANGDRVNLSTRSYNEHPGFSLSAELPSIKSSLRADYGKKGWSLERDTTNEHRFKSPEVLQAALDIVLPTLIAMDPDWPEPLAACWEGDFDPGHPALGGRTVPPRHQGIVGTLLGAPYDRALAFAERFAARTAAKARKAEADTAQPDALPDGAMFGDIPTGRLKDVANAKIKSNARMAIAATVSEPDAKRRRRALVGVMGMDDRPFTPKHISRMTRYTRPDALRLLPDSMLGFRARDITEAAFRLSFTLDGDARNPMLGQGATTDAIEIDVPGCIVRLTRFEADNGNRLTAFGVVHGRDQDPWSYALSSGAGFAVARVGGVETVWSRPSSYNKGVGLRTHLPDADRTAIETAIKRAFGLDPARGEALADQFAAEWAALAKEFPVT